MTNDEKIRAINTRIAHAKHFIAMGMNIDYWKKEVENMVKELEKLMKEPDAK
jgi:hypothetical protein